MDISEKIRRILEDYFAENMFNSIEFSYDKENSCYISPVVEFSDQIVAKAVLMVIAVYPMGFDISIYCAGYTPETDHMAETMTFIGLLNNILFPGTSMKYIPGGKFRIYRYVDCIHEKDGPPSISKIHMNMQIALSMYERVIDQVLAVDLGYVSAVEAFKSLIEQ